MDRVFGLDQGFDSYTQPGEERFMGTVRRAIQWLEENPSRPFFLFLHSYEVHHPYEPSPEYLALFEQDYQGSLPPQIDIDLLRQINRKELDIDSGDLAHIISAYDAEIRSMDDALGVLVETLRRKDLYDETMIVFTSDHGEEFGEHGVVGWHSHSLYDELLRVPLIIKMPRARSAGTRVDSQVRSIDIAPTVLSTLELSIPEDFEGVALADLVGDPDPVELETVSRMDRAPGRDISSFRTHDWKLYRKSLFDLGEDPQEQWDLALSRRDVVEELQKRLDEAIAARERLEPEQVTPTDSTLEELRALGYID
jgi:arylsulfatase A-like enzyme